MSYWDTYDCFSSKWNKIYKWNKTNHIIYIVGIYMYVFIETVTLDKNVYQVKSNNFLETMTVKVNLLQDFSYGAIRDKLNFIVVVSIKFKKYIQ